MGCWYGIYLQVIEHGNGQSPMKGSFNGKIIYTPEIVHFHLWLQSTISFSRILALVMDHLRIPFFAIPSGNLISLWKFTIFHGKTHNKWPFSIAMLNYQRVIPKEMDMAAASHFPCVARAGKFQLAPLWVSPNAKRHCSTCYQLLGLTGTLQANPKFPRTISCRFSRQLIHWH